MNAHSVLRLIPDYFATDIKHFAKKYYRKPTIKLAQLKRKKLSHVQFIGITGSSGKTTTKELAHSILSRKFETCKSDDTNNQVYSVARTLLSLNSETIVCVHELGISQNEDFSHSVKLLSPKIGVVLNIGQEHYKAFRGREHVALEKSKLINNLPDDGVAILNVDDVLSIGMGQSINCKIFTFGCNQECDLRAINVRSIWPNRLQMTLKYKNETVDCNTQLCGEYLVYCVLAAVAIGLVHGISLKEAALSVQSFQPFLARMMPYETSSGIIFIRDDWKAPYWSIQESINFIKNAKAKRKIIIIGTLSDFNGTRSTKYRNVSKKALDAADFVFFVGPNANKGVRIKDVPENKSLRAFSSTRELSVHLKSLLSKGDLVLLKGSGSDHLARLALMYEKDVKCWRERCGRSNLCDNCKLLSIS